MSLFIKNIFLVQLYLILAILYPTSLANLVVEVGTRHSHQTLLKELNRLLILSNFIDKKRKIIGKLVNGHI